ncbi:hypothetical protein CYY_007630 [Polysphondylium violaceum]|uniref:Uncharacterized protein n=1 Tax=Polysphondylium violaceum TaxID=133409 RepID=A0A8J4V4R9_9MYCE|nr:hypothetical protein CYY_007630 [Polysphondylium violaceum]
MTNNNNTSGDIQLTIYDASQEESSFLNDLWHLDLFKESLSGGAKMNTPIPGKLSYDEQVESFKMDTIENIQYQEYMESVVITPDEIIAKNINRIYCRITDLVQRPTIIKISFNRPKDIGNYELMSLYDRAYHYIFGFLPTGNKYQVLQNKSRDLTYNGYAIIKVLDDSIACQYNFKS